MQLNQEQLEAVDTLNSFLKSNKTEIKLLGKGGTGKTSLLAEFVAPLRMKIAIATLSHKAKAVIKGKIPHSPFIQFHTLASLLNMKLNMETGDFTEEGKNPVIQSFDLIIIDECSMVSEDTLALLRKKKSKSCKIIYAGDFRQLPPIGEKESALEKAIMIPTIELHTRVRQAVGNTILEYSDEYGDNLHSRIILNRIDNANIKHYFSFTEALNQYKNDFKQCLTNPDAIKVVCFRNITKNAINNLIREIIFNKAKEIPFQTGDVIIMDSNWNDLENSQEFTVVESNQMLEGNYLLYKIEAVKTNSLDDKHYFLYVLNELSVPHHTKDVADLFNKYKKTKKREDLSAAWNLKQQYADVSYNYCVSAHKSQGSSYNKTIIVEDDIMKSFMSQKQKNQCMYVAITRSKEQTIIVKQK